MNNSTLVYYYPGTYGTFVEWCLNYFTDLEFQEILPFKDNGSAHNFKGNMLEVPDESYQYIVSDNKHKFARVHPGHTCMENYNRQFDNDDIATVLSDLQLLNQHFDKILFLYYNIEDSLAWVIDNQATKISAKSLFNAADSAETRILAKQAGHFNPNFVDNLFVKTEYEYHVNQFKTSCKIQDVQKWGYNSIDEMPRWAFREMVSLFIENRFSRDLYKDETHLEFAKTYKNLIPINITQLRDNFSNTINDIVKKLDLNMVRENKIDSVYQAWISLQHHKNKDSLIKIIVESIVSDHECDWGDRELTFFNEVLIQNQLRKQGWEIKCHGLDIFPTNAKEFNKLIYKI